MQGMAAQQGKLQLDHNAATSKTTKARESLTSTLPSKPSVFTGDNSPSVGNVAHCSENPFRAEVD